MNSHEDISTQLKILVTGKARYAVRQAADFLVTQLSHVHPSQELAAHVEMSPVGIAASVVIDSQVALFMTYGTGVFGLPETEPHRRTPWVYKDDSGFHTTWGQKPDPWFLNTCEASREAMEIIMAGGMNEFVVED